MKTAFFSLPVIILIAGTSLAAAQGVPGKHFLENWDLDEDGEVTLAELTERRDAVFASFDANEDGALTSEEYELFDEARASHHEGDGSGQGAGKGGGEMMDMSMNDANGDGEVTHSEFMAQAEVMLAALDKNEDGVVKADDFMKR